MSAPNLTPYRQGRLDGLCGIYAVINAVRLACSTEENHIRLPSALLFETCLRYLALDKAIPEPVIHGLDTAPLLVCLRLVRNYLQVQRDISIRQTTPFVGRRGMDLRSVIAIMREFINVPYRSILVGYSTTHPEGGHWTVIKSAEQHQFRLLDSDGLTRLKFADLTYRDLAKAKAGRKRNLTPTSIIFLERLTKL